MQRQSVWNDLKAKHFPGNDWSRTRFTTDGIKYDYFKYNNNETYEEMIGVYPTPELAEKFLPELINSGSTVPKKVILNKGDKLYKIVPKGNNIKGPSPYYLSRVELDFVKQYPEKLEQVLGLPLSSVSAEYDVFQLTVKAERVEVYESTIAPTKQFTTGNPDEFYTTTGGRKQTLVINNSNDNIWEKDSSPIETIVPDKLPQIK